MGQIHQSVEPVASGRRQLALVVDGDPAGRDMLLAVVNSLGFQGAAADGGIEAIEKFGNSMPTLLVVDMTLPDTAAPKVLRYFREQMPTVRAIALASSPDVRSIVDAARAGANEVILRPTDLDELRDAVRRACEASTTRYVHSKDDASRQRFVIKHEAFFRRSEAMRSVERHVLMVADVDTPVLVFGETGTGKTFVGRTIHALSRRSSGPCVSMSCADLPVELIEAELFGDAATDRAGRLELADHGSLVLKYIEQCPPGLQPRLLRVLEDGEFSRVGARELRSVDIRIVATATRRLQALVAAGQYRRDLAERVTVATIHLPPLRERRDEIRLLAEDLREHFTGQFQRHAASLSAPTVKLLESYEWPGNIRELSDLIKRYVVFGDEAGLQTELQERLASRRSSAPAGAPAEFDLRTVARVAAQEAEIAMIRDVLEAVQWNRTRAARLLKISYKTLLKKLHRAGLGPKPRAS